MPGKFLLALAAGLPIALSGYGGGGGTAAAQETTPLHEAVFRGKEDVARLLEAGADPNAKDGSGDPPLHEAV